MKNQSKFYYRKLKLKGIIIALLFPLLMLGQNLDALNKVDIKLDDGTTVILYGQSSRVIGQKTNKYYMLPTGLKIGSKPDGTPEFLFAKFTTEEKRQSRRC